MKINRQIELQILLDYGWKSAGIEGNVYYKDFYIDGENYMSLIINPVHFDSDFAINTVIERPTDYENIAVDMHEVLKEIELLKKLNILI